MPLPVPPEISRLRRALTIPSSRVAISWVSAPLAIRRSIVSGSRENLRIESSGPSSAQGGMIALMREPSARRASTQGCELVDPAADRGDDAVDDAQQMALVLELHRGRLEHAVLLDEDLLVAVDQDVGDRRVLEQGLERAQAQHLVEQLLDQEVELLGVERGRLARSASR